MRELAYTVGNAPDEERIEVQMDQLAETDGEKLSPRRNEQGDT
jgi:hypothetical protein